MGNPYIPLNLGIESRRNDTPVVTVNQGSYNPSVGAVIGGVVGEVTNFTIGALLTGALGSLQDSIGGTTMTAEAKAEIVRQNQITGLYNII